MFEHKILVPVTDNDGKPTAVQFNAMKKRILEVFGGYTEGAECTGAWRCGTKTFYDRVIPLYVTMPDDFAHIDKLESIVHVHVLMGMKQESAYIKHPDGSVQFLSEASK